MRGLKHSVACLGLASLLASPTAAFAEGTGSIRGRVSDTSTGARVAGATVILSSSKGTGTSQGRTTGSGEFVFSKLVPGSYQLLVIEGRAVTHLPEIRVAADETVTVTPVLIMDDAAERIIIRERVPGEPTPPQPIRATVKRLLPYSDEAMDDDVWGLAWVLLSIGDTGRVVGVQFLKRPGHDLDKIAVEEAFKLRFEPARDGAGKPVATVLLWKLEWPSYWWLRDAVSHDRPPPCAGSGPLPMEYMFIDWSSGNIITDSPVYRDCTPPDLSRASTEPILADP